MMRRAVALAGTLALLVLAVPAGAQDAGAVRLPTGLDAIALAPGADQFLLGQDFNERAFPGRVHDDELVEIDLGPDGTPARVRVTQRLTLVGQGDYSLRVPGPAATLETLPTSESQPGLRRGSVIWQGFSPGRRRLDARMDLYPEREAPRLPLRVTLELTANGAPLALGDSATGPFTAVLRIENVTAIPTRIADADADPRAVAGALDAIHGSLVSKRRPVPGVRGVPEAIPARGEIGTRTEPIEAPFRAVGFIAFPSTNFDVEVEGGLRPPSALGAAVVSFDVLLGGGRPLVHEVRIIGTASNLELGSVQVTGRPARPHPGAVAPPAGADTWAEALAGGGAGNGRQMLARAMSAMWRVARLRLYDGYIGNPDPIGRAASTYRYRIAPPVPPPFVAPPPPPRTLGTFGVVLAGFAGFALLFVMALQWAHA